MKKLFTLITVAVLALASLPAQAQFNGSVPYTVTLTNIPASIAAGTASNVSSAFLIGDKGFTVIPLFAGSGASTANFAFYGDVSADGVNWTTNGTAFAFSGTVAANGTGTVRGSVLIAPTTINNVKWARINVVSNATAVTLYTTNIVVSTWR